MNRYILLLVLCTLGVSAVQASQPVAGDAIAAGSRAMARFDPTMKGWLQTQDAWTQQMVLCSDLESTRDTAGLVALDCHRAAASLTPAKAQQMADSLQAYQSGYGYAYPTANDMARMAPQDRPAVHQAIGCKRIRDRIALQVELMRRGSTGYWNLQTMQDAERQYCGDNLVVTP